MPLDQTFFIQNAPDLAQHLLGCELVHVTKEDTVSGIIVETEAYTQDDAASHSYRGQTERTKVMFGPGGHAYVYFTYGMHYCFNVVCGPKGSGQAVLIRALQPRTGLELMRRRRGRDAEQELCSGPAKLVQAMGITKADYGKPLYEGNLYIQNKPKVPPEIMSGPRIGIRQAIDQPWRFWVANSYFISK